MPVTKYVYASTQRQEYAKDTQKTLNESQFTEYAKIQKYAPNKDARRMPVTRKRCAKYAIYAKMARTQYADSPKPQYTQTQKAECRMPENAQAAFTQGAGCLSPRALRCKAAGMRRDAQRCEIRRVLVTQGIHARSTQDEMH
ncbi:hypothetical protein quinque_006226 [Culex quinquefasciatus]